MEERITAEEAIQEIAEKAGRHLDEAKAMYNKVYDHIEATIKGSALALGEQGKIAAVVSGMMLCELPAFTYTKTCEHLKQYFLEKVL